MIVKLWWRCLWHCSLFWFQASFVPWELSKGPVMSIIVVVILIIHGIDVVNISKGHVMVIIIVHWWLILGLLLKHQSKIQNDQNRAPIRTNLNKDVKIWWTALFPSLCIWSKFIGAPDAPDAQREAASKYQILQILASVSDALDFISLLLEPLIYKWDV